MAMFRRLGFAKQRMGLGEYVPRHTGTENTVFREKQESSVAATWTLGQTVSAG